jgi:hypothetical protein
MRVRTAVRAHIAPVSQSPARLLHGSLGGLLGNAPGLTVTAATEDDDLSLSALLGDRAGTGQGLNGGRCRKAIPVVAELGQQPWCQELPRSGKGIEEESIGMLGEELSQRRERALVRRST